VLRRERRIVESYYGRPFYDSLSIPSIRIGGVLDLDAFSDPYLQDQYNAKHRRL